MDYTIEDLKSAILDNDTPRVLACLEDCVDPTVPDGDERTTALDVALEFATPETLDFLLDNSGVVIQEYTVRVAGHGVAAASLTPMMTAVLRCSPEHIEVLMKHGAVLGSEYMGIVLSANPPALHMAIDLHSEECVDTIIRCGHPDEYRCANGRTALLHAIYAGRVSYVERLYTHGASLDARDNAGRGVQEYLADLRSSDAKHDMGLFLSKYRKHDIVLPTRVRNDFDPFVFLEGLIKMNNMQVVHLFCRKHKMSLYTRCPATERTLLHVCESNMQVWSLTSLGLSVKERDIDMQTPLHTAANANTAAALVAAGVDWELPDASGNLALHKFVTEGRPDVVEIVLASTNPYRRTMMMRSRSPNHNNMRLQDLMDADHPAWSLTFMMAHACTIVDTQDAVYD